MVGDGERQQCNAAKMQVLRAALQHHDAGIAVAGNVADAREAGAREGQRPGVDRSSAGDRLVLDVNQFGQIFQNGAALQILCDRSEGLRINATLLF